MIKLAESNGKVYVEMSTVEFEGLAKADVSMVSDGSSVSLLWIKTMKDLMDSRKTQLLEISNSAGALQTAIQSVL